MGITDLPRFRTSAIAVLALTLLETGKFPVRILSVNTLGTRTQSANPKPATPSCQSNLFYEILATPPPPPPPPVAPLRFPQFSCDFSLYKS